MEVDAAFEGKILGLIAEAVSGKFRKVPIAKDTHLQKQLGLDSIGMLALVFRFEESFGIDIAQMGIDIDIAQLKTVDDLFRVSREIMTKAQSVKAS